MPSLRSLTISSWMFLACSPARPVGLEPSAQREVVNAITTRLRAAYVSPDAAEVARHSLASQLDAGGYDGLARRALAERLTRDLQAATHDKHLRVSSEVEPPPLLDDRHPKVFGRVEHVGDVAYLEVVSFGVPPESAGAEIASTMSSIADARAFVFDLRSNAGGHPGTVALLASYVFDDEPVHLNSMLDRASGLREESFTDPHVSGTKVGAKKPAFAIIGPRTFSAAEEFTYDLQALHRITVVGENSGGGAHSGGFEPLPHGFSVFVPSRRPINPVTHTNWEGVGVTPDVRAPSHESRATALRLALESLSGTSPRTAEPPK